MNTINRILICCTFIFILSFALFPLKGNETAKAARNDFQNLKENFVFFFEDTVNHSDYNKQKSNNPINISSKFSNEKAKNRQQYLMVVLAAIMSGISARFIFIKK